MKFKKIIYINIFLLIISCSDDISSSPSNEILIVSSPEDSLYAAPFIEDFLKSQNRFLPGEEDFYSVNWISPNEFEQNSHYAAIIMLKLSKPSDYSGDKLFDRIFTNKNYGSNVDFIRDFYVKNQTIIGIEVQDAIELNEVINTYSKNILNELDSNLNLLFLEKYYEKPKNEEIINEIKEKYGISIFIDHEYQKLDSKDGILWIGRGYPHWNDPYRWIIIREIDLCENPKICLNEIQETFNQIMLDSAYISISPYHAKQSYRYSYYGNYLIGGSYQYYDIMLNPDDLFQDNNNNKKWDETEILIKDYNFNKRWDPSGLDSIPNVGGPYISYIYNKENSSILLVGLINNPGQDKMIYVKQMESIFKDIK